MRTSQWRNFQWRFGTVALLVALLVGCVAPASAPSGSTGESQAASAESGEAVVLRTSSVSEPTTLDPNLAERLLFDHADRADVFGADKHQQHNQRSRARAGRKLDNL